MTKTLVEKWCVMLFRGVQLAKAEYKDKSWKAYKMKMELRIATLKSIVLFIAIILFAFQMNLALQKFMEAPNMVSTGKAFSLHS